MKKLLLFCLLLSVGLFANAQLKNILNKAKQKVANKTIEKTEAPPATTEKDSIPATKPTSPDTTTRDSNTSLTTPSIKSYSKYDFVPGEKIVGFEDFMTGSIGDFPAGWNTNAAGEIVTIEGMPGRWLKITRPGVFVPEFTDQLPDNFTFEFDLLHGIPIKGASFTVVFAQLDNKDRPQDWTMSGNAISIELDIANTGSTNGGTQTALRKNAVSEAANQFYTSLLSDQFNPAHISIWRQKERIRVYVNEEKLWDIPKGLATGAALNSIVFYTPFVESDLQHYIGNLRLGIGAPDTRNKFLIEGKWVTHGILFDVNSANIKSQSYGSLKEIANILKESGDVKVKIIGHTDADGSEPANLDLSKRRASAVKAALAKEFGIDEGRMETDGKGESQPIDKNDTPAGKANNRRVEFIKLP